MRLAAVVGVLDEAEMIERCVNHLVSLGIQRILVHDRGSTDGTLRVVDSVSGVVPIDVHRSTADESLDPAEWSSVQLGWARTVGADWVLFLDADEMWIVDSGSVERELAAATADVISVRRYNVVVTMEGPRLPQTVTTENLAELDLFVEPGFIPHDSVIADPHLRWIRGTPMPKVAVRPGRVAEIVPGQHGARVAGGTEATAETVDGLLIAHLPFTTFDRFERKAHNVRETIRRHPDFFVTKRGWHWQRWAAMSVTALRDEFDAQLISQQELETLRAEGSVRSAAELFRSWAGR